ncbi:MAG TPA: hypothetical protein VJ180_01485, partial [Pyrinomonadaceae bacterium]|nr:hypothetical protein [Pyrinomonadaceae bacterium]
MPNLLVKTASSIHEIDSTVWDQLSGDLPFQSHRWYAYGEQVMADCTPIYLLIWNRNELVGRSSLWLVRDEPLPRMLGFFRRPVRALLKQWPLLICRSPLSYTSGLIMTGHANKAEILSAVTESALAVARKHRASFVLVDYLSKAQILDWPRHFSLMGAPEPGMKMENRWADLDEYLASAGKKERQHYKRVLREAGKLGIRIERHSYAPHIEEALPLIRSVEASHDGLPNPWARPM